MNEYFPVEFLPGLLFAAVLAVVGIYLKEGLRREAKRQRAAQPELPHARARHAR